MTLVSYCETSSEVTTPRNLKRKAETFDETGHDDEYCDRKGWHLPRHCGKKRRIEDDTDEPKPELPGPEKVETIIDHDQHDDGNVDAHEESNANANDTSDNSTDRYESINGKSEDGWDGWNHWNVLSRVWLTKNSLTELDRRACGRKVPKPVDDNLAKIVPAESIDMKALKRFARQGGPDLGDLRGVSLFYIFFS